MAISGGDGSIILTTKVDETGLKKGLGSMKKLGATAGKAFLAIGVAAAASPVAITKMAVSAYADYEQMVGGIETLWGKSAKKIIDYANDAFYTAGVSANEYMRQVTLFSVALIRSTAGDTDKAADIANMALIDISDNVNKMGSSMESVTLAYQGFAKQQYMLLDNLKLGYGGTKTEMERLLKDAQAITGVKYDISNLADVYTAIHVIQEELGITGTTAKEAEKTITGSANMMKAAWQNVLSAIAGGGDLDKAINNLVYSIQKYFENIVPVVERSLQGIGQLIQKVAPMLVQSVARALIKAIPSLLDAVYQMIIGLAKGIYQGIIDLFKGGTQKTLEAQINSIKEATKNQNRLTDAVEETAEAQKKSLAGFDEIQTLSATAVGSEDITGTSGGSDFTSPINADIEKSESQTSGFAMKILEFFEPVTTALGNLFEPIEKSFNEIDWDGMGERVSTWLENFSNSNIEATTSGINSLKTAFEVIEEPAKRLWNDALQPIVEDFGGWIVDIVDQTGDSFDYFSEKLVEYKDEIEMVIDGISTIIQFIWSIISPIIDSAVKGIGNVLRTTIDFIFSIIRALGNFFAFFGNIFKGIKELFKGNTDDAIKYFKQALGNLANLAIGLANSIISVINNLWSLIFDSFKGTVNAIGGLVSKIGSFFGANWDLKWDAKAPLIPLIPKHVPKLATGAVIPPNKEFMAVLGDQRNGRNLEAPESLIRQIVREESGAGSRNITIQATGSMAQLIRLLNLEIKEENTRATVF